MPEEPVVAFSERKRYGVAALLMFLAVVHVIFPSLALDGVFLGLLALAGIVLLFDIESIEALGVKAKARQLRAAADVVAAADLPASQPPEPSQLLAEGAPAAETPEAEHREPSDLMPPVERIARILWAAEQIRVELVILAGTNGFLTPQGSWSHYRPQHLAPLLADKGIMPAEFIDPIRSVADVRNSVAHGERIPGVVLESIDELALTVLSRLREIPRTYHRVEDGDVTLFLDQSLTTQHPSRGVMLQQRDREGNAVGRRVYPTRATYKSGRFVTWAWDMSRVTNDEAWYVDPDDGQAKMAFSSAAAFAGREFPDQWGLRYRAGPLVDE